MVRRPKGHIASNINYLLYTQPTKRKDGRGCLEN